MSEIKGCSVFTGKNIRLRIDKGRILEVEETGGGEKLPFISPGFIDTQMNGYKGLDYSAENLEIKDILKLTEMLAETGTACHFPTIMTNSRELITRNLKTIAEAIDKFPELDSAIPGMHVEGPYISSEDGARGAHNLMHVRDPDYDEFLEWQEASGRRIRQLTLAPERKGAMDFIRKVSSEGVVISIGHTAADPGIIREAVKAGAKMSTHLGNGSHSMLPRLKNYLWEQLASDDLHASIITDGFHLPPSVVKSILRTKGTRNLLLVSDVALPGGLKPGRYSWGGIEAEVFEDGHIGLADTEYLAGAGHLLDHCLAWLMNELEVSPANALTMCTVNPYRIFFPSDTVPGLNPGDPANLTLFRWGRGDSKLNVLETWCSGRSVYKAE